jgi:nicotinamidase/pyrazinamidase
MMDYKNSILLAIDIQNDFCPGGALAVKDGDKVIEVLNHTSESFIKNGGRVIATQDWHPQNHISFADSHSNHKPGDIIDLASVKGQVLWPKHCVQGSEGAAFHKDYNLNLASLIIRKGFRQELDSYSAFFENDRVTLTGLESYLKGLAIDTVYIGGLATDYCVFYSAMDSFNAGFKTYVLLDACKGVGYPEGSVEKAIDVMKNKGINIINSGEIN